MSAWRLQGLVTALICATSVHALGTLDRTAYEACLLRDHTDTDGRYMPVYDHWNGVPCSEDLFENFEFIGRGASSTVYRATYDPRRETTTTTTTEGLDDRDWPIPVALKFVLNPKKFEQAHMEQCLLANVRHDNMPEFYCAFARETHAVLVMQYIPGTPADQAPIFYDPTTSSPALLEEETDAMHSAGISPGPESAAGQTIPWVLTLAAATSVLGFLHSHGIMLRDLKPENVIVGEERAYVIDFGVAISRSLITGWRGTPIYSAPEVLEAWRTAHLPTLRHFAADWYSLGLTLYVMIVGRVPFRDDCETDCYGDIARGIRRHMVPSGVFRELLMGLMHRDRAQRYGLTRICRWIQRHSILGIPHVEECEL